MHYQFTSPSAQDTKTYHFQVKFNGLQGSRNKAAAGAQRRLLPRYAPPTFLLKKTKTKKNRKQVSQTSQNDVCNPCVTIHSCTIILQRLH